ncbi:MAG TPA: glycosyltransferase [Caulobacteraceae bacterium]|nr:glycosyltransferase [Caulobacteraceae bacterium]
MIFVTTGTSLPFDRLVRAVDALAPRFGDERFLAQIGEGEYRPANMEWVRNLTGSDYADQVNASRLIVAHAGMGSLITAMEAAKPIVVLPRRLKYDEINTDHQLATAKHWVGRTGVFVAMGEDELENALRAALAAPAPDRTSGDINCLVDKLKLFIENA